MHVSDAGTITVGSDRRATSGRAFDFDHKWTRLGPWWVGRAGPRRLASVLASIADPAADVGGLVEQIKAGVADDGWKPIEDAGDPAYYKLQFLAVLGGSAWRINGSFDTMEIPAGELVAIGSGEDFAHGAFHALRDDGLEPEDLVWRCLKAAIELDPGCGGDPFVHNIKENGQ